MSTVEVGFGNGLRPYLSVLGKHLDFTPFASLGKPFVALLAKSTVRKLDTLAHRTAQVYWDHVSAFLAFLIQRICYYPGLKAALAHDHSEASWDDWEDICLAFKHSREGLMVSDGSPRKARTTGEELKCINVFLHVWARAGIIPPWGKIPLQRNYRRRDERPIKSLAELKPHSEASETDETLAGGITALVKGHFSGRGIDEDFLRALAAKQDEPDVAPSELVARVRDLNNSRLNALRQHAEDTLLACVARFDEGCRLLRKATISAEDIERDLQPYFDPVTGFTENGNARNLVAPLRRMYFPEGDLGLANYLRLIDAMFDGLVPPGVHRGRGQPLGQFHQTMWNRVGGRAEMLGYLYATDKALLAAMTIVMADTAMNASPCMLMPFDCLTNGGRPNWTRLATFKMRAKGKLICEEFPEHDPDARVNPIQGVRHIQRMTARTRRAAEKSGLEEASHLFIYQGTATRYGNARIRHFDKDTLKHRWRVFVGESQLLKNLPISPSTLRSSVLLRTALAHQNIFLVEAQASHKSDTTSFSYVNKLPFKLLNQSKIRAFLAQLQAMSVAHIDGVEQLLGISQKEHQELLHKAKEHGLLSDKFETTGHTTTADSADCLEDGSVEPVVLIGTAANFKEIILLNRYLSDSSDELRKADQERWQQKLLPLLAFTEVALDAGRRGLTSPSYRDAIAELGDNNE